MIDNVRVKIITKTSTEFFKDRDIELEDEWDLVTGYQEHKKLVKEIAIENNIKFDDVAIIKVYTDRENKFRFYYFLEMWDVDKNEYRFFI